MARNKNDNKPEEEVKVEVQVDLPPLDSVVEVKRRVAFTRDNEDPIPDGEAPKEKEMYEVERGGNVNFGRGVVCKLPIGKRIDSVQYDIKRLRMQGIKLRKLGPDE